MDLCKTKRKNYCGKDREDNKNANKQNDNDKNDFVLDDFAYTICAYTMRIRKQRNTTITKIKKTSRKNNIQEQNE